MNTSGRGSRRLTKAAVRAGEPQAALRQCNSMGSRGSSRGGETQVAGARTAADMARAAGAAMARKTGTISNEEVAQTISVVPHLV